MLTTLQRFFRSVGALGTFRAIYSKYVSGSSQFKVKLRGCKYPFYLRHSSSDIVVCESIFNDQEYAFSFTSQPSVIVDAGANVGMASIYFANRFPDAKIFAIEPEKDNFLLLQKNTAPYKGIVAIHAALWNEVGEINLVDPGLGDWGFMTESNGQIHPNGPHSHSVASITVDKLMEDYKLDRIDVLKIDIEGAEKEVFQSAEAWIGRIDSMIIELHDRMKPGCTESVNAWTSGFENVWERGENVFFSRSATMVVP